MIIAIGGIPQASAYGEYKPQYKQKYYQPQPQTALKERVSKDFGEIFKEKINELNVDILI